MAQQTAVEWLANELPQPDWSDPFWKLKLEQAIEMEKEQITQAYLFGLLHPIEIEATKQAEQYYNETYNK